MPWAFFKQRLDLLNEAKRILRDKRDKEKSRPLALFSITPEQSRVLAECPFPHLATGAGQFQLDEWACCADVWGSRKRATRRAREAGRSGRAPLLAGTRPPFGGLFDHGEGHWRRNEVPR